MENWTDARKLEAIETVSEVFIREANMDDGDKHLSQAVYAMEAIDAVLAGGTGNPVLRQFLDAS